MFRKGAGRKGREFSNKATRKILSACPEFSFKSSLLWFSCHHFCCKVYGFQKKALVKPLSNAQQRFQETSLRVENSTLGFLTHFCWYMVSR